MQDGRNSYRDEFQGRTNQSERTPMNRSGWSGSTQRPHSGLSGSTLRPQSDTDYGYNRYDSTQRPQSDKNYGYSRYGSQPTTQKNDDNFRYEPRYQSNSNYTQGEQNYRTGSNNNRQVQPPVHPPLRQSFQPCGGNKSQNYNSSSASQNNDDFEWYSSSLNSANSLNYPPRRQVERFSSPKANNFPARGGAYPQQQSQRNFRNNHPVNPRGFRPTSPSGKPALQQGSGWQNRQAWNSSKKEKKEAPGLKQEMPGLVAPVADLKWKRGTGPVVNVRFLVNGCQVGAILGKMGVNIKCLKAAYGESVHIKVYDRPRWPEAIFSMSGDLGTVSAALLEVLPKFKSFQDKSVKSELKLMVHDSLINFVTGQDGEVLDSLSESSGTTVYVYEQLCPLSTDRIVSSTGEAVAITNCIADILEILAPYQPVGDVQNYNTENRDESTFSAYGGYRIHNLPIAIGPDFRGIEFIPIDAHTMRVSVTKEHIPYVFGHHNSFRRELRQAMKLQVTLEQAPAKSLVRSWLLVGGPEQLVTAQLMLQLRYTKALQASVNGVVPPTGAGKRKQADPDWATDEIKEAKQQRRKLERLYFKARITGDKDKIEATNFAYRNQLRHLGHLSSKAKSAWEDANGIMSEKRVKKLAYIAAKKKEAEAKKAEDGDKEDKTDGDTTTEIKAESSTGTAAKDDWMDSDSDMGSDCGDDKDEEEDQESNSKMSRLSSRDEEGQSERDHGKMSLPSADQN